MSLRLVMNYHYNGSVGMLFVDERCMRVLFEDFEVRGRSLWPLPVLGPDNVFRRQRRLRVGVGNVLGDSRAGVEVAALDGRVVVRGAIRAHSHRACSRSCLF